MSSFVEITEVHNFRGVLTIRLSDAQYGFSKATVNVWEFLKLLEAHKKKIPLEHNEVQNITTISNNIKGQ